MKVPPIHLRMSRATTYISIVVLLTLTALSWTSSIQPHRFYQPPDTACIGESIYQLSKFEPSDLDFDRQNNTLYVVSDNGKLAAINATNGNVLKVWKVQKKLDLEGLALIPSRPGFAYLGVEWPAEVVEFYLADGVITRRWPIQDVFDQYPSPSASTNAGLESLVYIPYDNGYLYAGRQADTRIFIVDLPPPYNPQTKHASSPLNFRGTILPPGSNIDLSAMTVYKNTLFFMYDEPRQLIGIDLSDPKWKPTPSNSSNSNNNDLMVDLDAKQDASLGVLHMHRRGMEGIVFTNEYAFIAIDSKTEKDLLRFKLDAFWSCFSRDGDGKVLAARSLLG